MADKTADTEGLLILGAVGLGLWMLWPLISGINKAGTGLVNAVGGAIDAVDQGVCQSITSLAQYYAQVSGSGAVIPEGVVVMPNGGTVPVASLVGNVATVGQSESASFVWNNATYYICGPSDQNGNWLASVQPCAGLTQNQVAQQSMGLNATCCAPQCCWSY